MELSHELQNTLMWVGIATIICVAASAITMLIMAAIPSVTGGIGGVIGAFIGNLFGAPQWGAFIGFVIGAVGLIVWYFWREDRKDRQKWAAQYPER